MSFYKTSYTCAYMNVTNISWRMREGEREGGRKEGRKEGRKREGIVYSQFH